MNKPTRPPVVAAKIPASRTYDAAEATPKLVRDRRARILIAGQSLPIRINVTAPKA